MTSKIIGVWSNKGCETSEKEPLYTKCSCDHMTNYAVLMWLGEKAPEDREAINILTKVGCLVSIAALALAVGLLLYLRSTLSSERIIIHMHLMTVTLIALLLFLVGIDKTENKLVCQFITIGLHFFYMSMFSWMLVEGIHLYRQIVAVFDSEKSRIWVYFALGWGIPIIVVGITSGIFFNQYKDHEICWLEVKDNSIWAFLGPIIPILLVNVAVLFMVLRIVMSAAKLQQEKPIFNSVKKGARSSLLLLPILGTTWIVGYFQHNLLSLQYVFVTLNAFQGFFMALFHCFMSGEVNSALKQKIRRVKESSLGGASTVDSVRPL
ncbi:adhesion G-protein coupled receptor D1-like [Acanthaster planci]|uniref:Adhesion G-protein coupled receptor D1-like n=1 Tax=Acanthaster planci TaxID=133434 RepID=A0A8B7YPI8_ACAPL|nr:adhesion G-protein coupled receptor D1-like [Acanthaster planci]